MTTNTTTGHDPRCVENTLCRIAENNAVTEIEEPGRALTPETEAEALEWLGNGNSDCWWDGEHCHV